MMTNASDFPTDVVRFMFKSLDALDRCNFSDAFPVHAHVVTSADRELGLLEYAFRADKLKPTKAVMAILGRHLDHATTAKLLGSPHFDGEWVAVLRIKAAMSRAARGSDIRLDADLSSDAKFDILRHLATLSVDKFDFFSATTCFEQMCDEPYFWPIFIAPADRDKVLHALLFFMASGRVEVVTACLDAILRRLETLSHDLPPAVGSMCLEHCINGGLLDKARTLLKDGHVIGTSDPGASRA